MNVAIDIEIVRRKILQLDQRPDDIAAFARRNDDQFALVGLGDRFPASAAMNLIWSLAVTLASMRLRLASNTKAPTSPRSAAWRATRRRKRPVLVEQRLLLVEIGGDRGDVAARGFGMILDIGFGDLCTAVSTIDRVRSENQASSPRLRVTAAKAATMSAGSDGNEAEQRNEPDVKAGTRRLRGAGDDQPHSCQTIMPT